MRSACNIPHHWALTKKLFAAGYLVDDSAESNFFIPGNDVIISSEANIAAAPKASVKVSGNTAKFTVKKYSNADGYEVRIYDVFDAKLFTTKTIKKNGSAKRTLTYKKVPAGMYAAIVVPYTTVDGAKVYGSESTPVYFNITK